MPGSKQVSIGDNVAVSATENQDVKIEANGRILGKLGIRIYKGAELDLRIVPSIVTLVGSVVQSVRKTFPTMVGKAYIDGDDDKHTWDMDEPVYAGETIRFVVTNVNATFTYDWRANFTIVFDEV